MLNTVPNVHLVCAKFIIDIAKRFRFKSKIVNSTSEFPMAINGYGIPKISAPFISSSVVRVAICTCVANSIFKFANEVHNILIDFHFNFPLEIAAAVFAMPLFAELPAGSTHKGHRHSAAHSADFLGVGGLAVGTDDTLAAGEVLLLLLFCFPFFYLTGCFKCFLFTFVFLTFAL